MPKANLFCAGYDSEIRFVLWWIDGSVEAPDHASFKGHVRVFAGTLMLRAVGDSSANLERSGFSTKSFREPIECFLIAAANLEIEGGSDLALRFVVDGAPHPIGAMSGRHCRVESTVSQQIHAIENMGRSDQLFFVLSDFPCEFQKKMVWRCEMKDMLDGVRILRNWNIDHMLSTAAIDSHRPALHILDPAAFLNTLFNTA